LLDFAGEVLIGRKVGVFADVNPVDEAAPDGNVEITDRRRDIPFLHRHAFWLAA